MISVISPTYNCADYIKRSYFCLSSQNYSNWEWIVVNDGSTDETSSIFKEICQKDSRVKYFNLDKNCGRGFARDFAMKQTSGDIVAIWDVDDLYTPDRLLKIRNSIDSGFDFFCSYALLVDNDLNIKGARHFYSQLDLFPKFVHATLAFNKLIANKFNLGYAPSMRAGEDLDIMLKLESHCKGYYCEEYLMIYVEDREVNLTKAISANKNQLQTVKKIFAKEDIKYSLYFKLKYIFKFYFKILILYFFYLNPSFYLKTVKYRYSEHVVSKKLNGQILKLLKGDFE